MIFIPNGRGGMTMIPTGTNQTQHETAATQTTESVDKQHDMNVFAIIGCVLAVAIFVAFVVAFIVGIIKMMKEIK